MCTLQKQFDFFQKNKNTLMAQFKGQYIVISDALEVTGFEDRLQAYTFGAKTYGLGNFMLQECSDGGIATINTFNSVPYIL